MKTILLLLALTVILAIPAAAQVGVNPQGFYCTPCYACPYAGYPCPLQPGYYWDPNAIFSYDDYYRYGGYYVPGRSYQVRPESQFPPYLGIDPTRQWFVRPY